jgi:hypothetical protein
VQNGRKIFYALVEYKNVQSIAPLLKIKMRTYKFHNGQMECMVIIIITIYKVLPGMYFASLSQITHPPMVQFGQKVIDGNASLLVSGEMDNDHWYALTS